MAFFTRPDLNDIQFKQTTGSTLTLSGDTKINSITGLSINDGNNYVELIVTGGTNGDVWTYVNGRMILTDSMSGGIYNGLSPTTCTVGGLPSGTNISGCTISCIIQDMLVPVQYPILSNPSNCFTAAGLSSLYEVGYVLKGEVSSAFNRGTISPAYGTSGYRSGLPNKYEYNMFGNTVDITSTDMCYDYSFPDHEITYGNNIIRNRVFYDEGEQPKDSRGCNYCSQLPAGCTSYSTININGIYPYYYGVYDAGNVPAGQNRPVLDALDVTGGTKVLLCSENTLCINFNSNSSDYIWFAIPEFSTDKTVWYVNPLNNGSIGGGVTPGGNLFPSYCSVTGVTTDIWSGINYKLYLSNYQTTIGTIMEIRNN